jgi:hypothetical protein
MTASTAGNGGVRTHDAVGNTLNEGGFDCGICCDFGLKHPMAKILTSRASAQRVAFIEDQLLVTTLIRIPPQLEDVIKGSHVLSPYPVFKP